MLKNNLLVPFLALGIIMAPMAAMSQQVPIGGSNATMAPAPGGGSWNGPGGGQGGGQGQGNGQRFQEKKAELLQRLSERQSCVQAANDFRALHECMERGGRGHDGRGEGPGGGQ